MESLNSNWTFSPSLMCMGFLSIKEDIQLLNKYFNSFHVDIMDGHFCKSIYLCPDYVKDISQISTLPIEVHLMVDRPGDYITDLIKNGSETIIIHVESSPREIFRLIDQVHSLGRKVGIAVCPSTPINSIYYLLEIIDKVTVLNVDVGFVGQPLLKQMLGKIKYLNQLRKREGYAFLIQADGGVCHETYYELIEAGIDDFVLGKKALFGQSSSLANSIELMQRDFKNAIQGYSINV